jgi:hypothetical protein
MDIAIEPSKSSRRRNCIVLATSGWLEDHYIAQQKSSVHATSAKMAISSTGTHCQQASKNRTNLNSCKNLFQRPARRISPDFLNAGFNLRRCPRRWGGLLRPALGSQFVPPGKRAGRKLGGLVRRPGIAKGSVDRPSVG